jgi:hypothetical protein
MPACNICAATDTLGMALHSVKAWLVGKELIWYAVLGALGSKEPFKGDGTLIVVH